MVTVGGQADIAGDPPIHPSRRWYWVAAGIIAGGVICVAFAVAGFFSLNRQIADFQRIPVPGQAGVTFTRPGGYVLYVEGPGQCCSLDVGDGGSAPFASWSMEVALQPVNGGPQVSLSTWRGITESYSAAGHQGQAAMYFTIDQPGRYELAARNAAPRSITDVAAGRGIGQGILIPIVLIVAGALAVMAGLVTGAVTALRRRGARRVMAVPPVMAPMGDGGSAMNSPGEHAATGYLVPPRSYLHGGPVGFGEAIKSGLRNWLVYRGRASLSAYWWFILFAVLLTVAVDVIVFVTLSAPAGPAGVRALATVVSLIVVLFGIYLELAVLALLVRRLHDIGRSGWWVLIGLVPFAGAIILLVFTLSEGTPGPNRYSPGAADAAAGALQVRCPECGAETAAAAQACARCEAPLPQRRSVADAEAAGPGAPIAVPPELAGQRTGPSPRRNALIIAGAGLATLTAVIAIIAISNSSTSSNSPASSVPSPTASSSPKASASQLAYDQLRPGHCVQVPKINTDSTWPNLFTVVPCTQPHTGEVFFTGDIWPQTMAYPGDNATSKQADARCGRAFTPYDGISPDQSAFTYAYDLPDSTSWPSGDRSVQCIAYDPNGASIDYSIKGSSK